MSHHHDHNDHSHDHSFKATPVNRILWALIINFIFLIIEVVGGILSGSLALLADAGHMLTDVAALGLALFVASLARKPATPERTFGLLRAEVLGAFINAASLFIIVAFILREAWLRVGREVEIDGPLMLIVATLGLIANLVSAWILHGGHKENVNVHGAFLHMVADALGSVGAIVAGIVIWTTGWTPIDPIMSVVISILIVWSSWGLLKSTVNILLESTPDDIDYHDVIESILSIEHVEKVHDLHIWTISSGTTVLTAHIVLCNECVKSVHWNKCRTDIRNMIRENYGIEHITLQMEPDDPGK